MTLCHPAGAQCQAEGDDGGKGFRDRGHGQADSRDDHQLERLPTQQTQCEHDRTKPDDYYGERPAEVMSRRCSGVKVSCPREQRRKMSSGTVSALAAAAIARALPRTTTVPAER